MYFFRGSVGEGPERLPRIYSRLRVDVRAVYVGISSDDSGYFIVGSTAMRPRVFRCRWIEAVSRQYAEQKTIILDDRFNHVTLEQ